MCFFVSFLAHAKYPWECPYRDFQKCTILDHQWHAGKSCHEFSLLWSRNFTVCPGIIIFFIKGQTKFITIMPSARLLLYTPPSRYPPWFLPNLLREFSKFREVFKDDFKNIRISGNSYGTPYDFLRITKLLKKSYGPPYDFLKVIKILKNHLIPPMIFDKTI